MKIERILLRVATRYKAWGEIRSERFGSSSSIKSEIRFETDERGRPWNFSDGGPSGLMQLDYYDIISLFDLDRNEAIFDAEGSEFTALHKAVYDGDINAVRESLENGMDINGRMPLGETALQMAINCQREEIANLLLDHGADPNLADYNGQTPLFAAIARTNVALLTRLMDKGADLDHQDNIGQTAVHLVVLEGKRELLEQILEHAPSMPDLDLLNDQGGTPLHIAVDMGNGGIAALLTSRSARIDIPDRRGLTALQLAEKQSDRSILKVLLERKVDKEPVREIGGNGPKSKIKLDPSDRKTTAPHTATPTKRPWWKIWN